MFAFEKVGLPLRLQQGPSGFPFRDHPGSGGERLGHLGSMGPPFQQFAPPDARSLSDRDGPPEIAERACSGTNRAGSRDRAPGSALHLEANAHT
eukprot:4242420-Pyramimonas_sp.AAC.1